MTGQSLGRAMKAGAFYWVLIFALGFGLGAVRTMFVADAPNAGRLIGVLIELPIMLLASWFACGWIARRLGVPARVWPRAVMGAVAFGLLILAEIAVGALLFRRTVSEHVLLYREMSYLLGLLAQVGFGLMPLLHLLISRTDQGVGSAKL